MNQRPIAAPPDQEAVRLRTENAELRSALEAREQENALLLQMVTDVISSLRVDQVLGHIIAHLVSALGCHGAFIYLWEPDRGRLVLRGASERYRALVGNIEMGRDEGLVGWSASTGRPAMVHERALEDPRFRYFPEMEEEKFQAILTVPMFGSDGGLVAVISMHTVAPQEFTDEHVSMVEAMAPLIGGAIESSRLYENSTRKLEMLTTLSRLVQTIGMGPHLDQSLHTLGYTAARVTASDLCLLYLAEPGQDGLAARAYLPSGLGEGEARSSAATIPRRPWEQLATMAPSSPALHDLNLPDFGEASALPDNYGTAPLVAAGEQIGLLRCFRSSGRPYVEDDAALITIIAGQAAAAVRNSQLADLLAERDIPALLYRDLTQGPADGEDLVRRRAALIGCDLARPHVPGVIDFTLEDARPRAAYQGMAVQVRRWLAAHFAGSSVHVDNAVLMLVRVPAGGSERDVWAGLQALQPALRQALAARVAGGIGGVCETVGEYRRGFQEAWEALRVARSMGDAGIACFDELGASRYLSRIPRQPASDEPRDRYQECVARVASYDARKGTALLGTLETFLGSGGNIARAAERLFIHRNTVVQRLEKLHGLLGFDPHESDHWLALQIALKLHAL